MSLMTDGPNWAIYLLHICCIYITVLTFFHSPGKPYLGYVDKIGVSFTDKSVATGFGSYIAQPMMRKAMEG